MKKYVLVEVLGNFTYKDVYSTNDEKTIQLRKTLFERHYPKKTYRIQIRIR